jgi:hypothetical protein
MSSISLSLTTLHFELKYCSYPKEEEEMHESFPSESVLEHIFS